MKLEKKQQENPLMFNMARIISDYYLVPLEALFVKTRKREIVQCRQVVYYFLAMTNNRIIWRVMGEFFGQYHATAIHGAKTISNLAHNNSAIKDELIELNIRLASLNNHKKPNRNGQLFMIASDPASNIQFRFPARRNYLKYFDKIE